MDRFEIEFCKSLPPRDEFNGILSQYYELIIQRMGGMGFEIDLAASQRALAEFWENSGDYLLPKGALMM